MTKPPFDDEIDIHKVSEESAKRRGLIAENANGAREDLVAEVELLGHQLRAISAIQPSHDIVEIDDARHLAIKALVARVAEVDRYANELAEEYERLCGSLAEEERQTNEQGSKWVDQLMAKQRTGKRGGYKK